MAMLILSFFSWWYGLGWNSVFASFQQRLQATADEFSVNQLLQTLFAPWRRIITYPGASMQARLQAVADNAFSRIIGFFVRGFVLLAAGVCLLLIVLFTAAECIIWPLLPVAVPFLLIAGLI